jgi:hypothetical protein
MNEHLQTHHLWMDMSEQLIFFIGCSIVNLPIAKGFKSLLAMGSKIGVHLGG